MIMEKTLDILLTDKDDFVGELLCIVEDNVVEQLIDASREREKLSRRSEKLDLKKGKIIRGAKKTIQQFANSRQIKIDEEKQTIGIHEGKTIYIGDKERLKNDFTVEPIEEDIVKGTLTKSEQRLYSTMLKSYEYINIEIGKYMNDLSNNEMKIVSFEKNILKDKEYSSKNYIVVSLTDGKVYLSEHEEEEVVEPEVAEVESNEEVDEKPKLKSLEEQLQDVHDTIIEREEKLKNETETPEQ
jgi:hypothetical protein